MNRIYLDNAASTSVSNEVLNEMLPYFTNMFGNPSSLHYFGRTTNEALDVSRDRIAKAIGAKPNEIYFTSGATESNNWALLGIAEKFQNSDKKHIITSQIEHPSILETCKYLETKGFKVTYLPVDSDGLVSIAELLHQLNSNTLLVSIMTANNEIGTIQNLKAIAKTVKEKGVLFHTDATQAIGAINIDVKEMGIDMLTLSGHKINGPKGIGALYIANDVEIAPLLHGGHQERNLRAGTVNVAGAVGLGKACEIACRDIIINSQKLRRMRDYFVEQVMNKIPYVKLNGHKFQRLPNSISLSFGMVEAEALMMMLDLQGIAVSVGSSCSSGSVEPSHVLKAIKLSPELAAGTIRITISKNITKEDIDFVVEKLEEIVKKLRAISPLTKSSIGEFDNV